mmetsp:Transcript_37714/g.98789  ORF Transcript_37714/g.98789 Transcript_37714/m.98789 type:complete len:217 (-) Transcript_37714:122-772(-)
MPIDVVQRAVAMRPLGSVETRPANRQDLGRACRGCGKVFTRSGEEIQTWQSNAFYNRYHPDCFPKEGPSNRGLLQERPQVEQIPDAWRRDRLVKAALQAADERAERRREQRKPVLSLPPASAAEQAKRGRSGVAAWEWQLVLLRRRSRSVLRANIAKQLAGCPCAICLLDFSCDVSSVLSLPCGHYFHEACFAPWLQRTHACPTCRADIRSKLPPL